MKKIGMMATYPARRQCLLEMLPTILPQLDELFIYCNDYEVSDLTSLYKFITNQPSHTIVKLIDPKTADSDLRDMGKFWMLHNFAGYIFLLDDDLLYPDDYTDRHIEEIKQHGEISCVHGRKIKKQPVRSYFSDTRSFHYKQPLTNSIQIDIAGTGTTAFRGDLWRLDVSREVLEEYKGMADIWFACNAKQRGINIFCLERNECWLQDVPFANQTTSLYEEAFEDDTFHCQKLNKYNWKMRTV